MGRKQFLGLLCAGALFTGACDEVEGRPDLADDDGYTHVGGKADGVASCVADPDPIVTDDDAWACLHEDFGPELATDWTEDALYAGNGRIDTIACVDGVVYGTAGAATALGVGVLWGGAILEPTPGGEVVATIASAPLLGFLGGVVGVKLSGSVNGCLVPLANIGITAARNGRDWVIRGLRQLLAASVTYRLCCRSGSGYVGHGDYASWDDCSREAARSSTCACSLAGNLC